MYCCPICGSTLHTGVGVSNGVFGPCGSYRIDYYTCDGCSVMFKDPNKFFSVKLVYVDDIIASGMEKEGES